MQIKVTTPPEMAFAKYQQKENQKHSVNYVKRNSNAEFANSQSTAAGRYSMKPKAPLANVDLNMSSSRPYELAQTPVNGIIVSAKWADMSKSNFGTYLNSCLNKDGSIN